MQGVYNPIDCGTGFVLATTATAQTVTSPDIINIWGTAGKFFVNVASASGTNPTTTVTIQGKDSVSGTYYTILASAALAGATTVVLTVGKGLTAATNVTANDFLPAVFRFSVAYGGTTPTIAGTIGMVIAP